MATNFKLGLSRVPIDLVRENSFSALRPAKIGTEDFLGLVESIKTQGFYGAILCRPVIDAVSGKEFLEVIDGLQRFTAAKQLALPDIPVDIREMSDSEVLVAQILANIHKIDTTPVEYSKQLHRILERDHLLTRNALAAQLGKSKQWLDLRLSLNKITDEKIAALIDEGRIVLTNAYALAKLPTEELPNWIDRAMTESPETFLAAVNARDKEIKEARRKGRDPNQAEFTPIATLQSLKDIKSEIESGSIAKVIAKGKAVDGFKTALLWVLHLDEDSINVQKTKYEERKRIREELKVKKTLERAEAKKKLNEEAIKLAEEAASRLGLKK